MPYDEPALTRAAGGLVQPPPDMPLLQVLDRLCPSIFAGLLDTDGVVRYANRAALQAIASTPDQVLGQRFDATPWWQACELSQKRLQQAMAAALQGEASRFDVRVATSGGDTLSMDFSLLPLYGPEGRVAWLVPSAHDVSEREQAQDQLRLTRHAVEQSNDALMQVGPDGVFRDVNAAACRLMGMERERLLRLHVWDIDSRLDPSHWPRRWRELRDLGSLRFESSVRHRAGYEIPVDVSVSLVKSDLSWFAHICMDDLSERRAAEHRIRQRTEELDRTVEALHREAAERIRAQQALRAHRDDLEKLVRERTAELRAAKEAAEADAELKSRFLADISHELRTPLNVILGFAQVLKGRSGMDERQRRAVQLIDDSGNHLLSLVGDLLDLSKIAAGRFDILPADIEPRRFFESVLGMARVRADQKPGLELVGDLPARWPPAFRADPTRLRQVLINLLDNAVKFTRQGRVTLRVRWRDPSTLSIEIEDTGVPLTEEQRARLFLPFEQVCDAGQRALGAGLGLAISQRLVQLMGGEIRVDSRPGHGNRFAFDLVVAPPPAVAAPTAPAPGLATAGAPDDGSACFEPIAAPQAAEPHPAAHTRAGDILQLGTNALRPGQRLVEDFVSPEGVLLLSAGQQLNDDLIDRIKAFEHKRRLTLTLAVTAAGDETGGDAL